VRQGGSFIEHSPANAHSSTDSDLIRLEVFLDDSKIANAFIENGWLLRDEEVRFSSGISPYTRTEVALSRSTE
jgi:hypothetical protein